MNGSKEVVAVFRIVPPNIYLLSVSVTPEGAGTVEINPTGPNYADSTVVTLTAEANTGYIFDHWTGALSGSANPKQITMNTSKEVNAVFVETWENVGNAGFSSGTADYISLFINSSGIPYVAYEDNANSDNLTVMKFSP